MKFWEKFPNKNFFLWVIIMVQFEVSFDNLNEALERLNYARVYQSPMNHSNEFNIEVSSDKGGNYDAMKKLVELAEKEGYIYDTYYEMGDCWGDYTYTAKMYVETGKKVRCYYKQNGVYIVGDD